MMTLIEMARLVLDPRTRLLAKVVREATPVYRMAFLAAGCSSGILRRLAEGAGEVLERLSADHAPGPGGREALHAWLQFGVRLGELSCEGGRYRLRGALARALADPRADAVAALLEEVATLHVTFLTRTPARTMQRQLFHLSEQPGELIARSSRTLEPFVALAVESLVPRQGPVRLLEVGCGSGTYIRCAAALNPELTALGLELQPEVARQAEANLRAWRLEGRAAVEAGDVRQRRPEPAFDLATLHNNIYYFPVPERAALLRHLRGFLRPGGRLLLTTGCQGGSLGMEALNLWAAATEGCGRLPFVDELHAALAEAGYVAIGSRRLVPVESFWAAWGTVPA